jgi:hypothetical protein
MLLDKRAHCLPREPALLEPQESERPIVLHSLADEHGSARPFPSGRVPKAQRVISLYRFNASCRELLPMGAREQAARSAGCPGNLCYP